MSLSDEIRAKVDEAERRLDRATRVPWDNEDGASGNRICGGKLMVGNAGTSDADLIVSVVNRERAQIEHARDVLERHPHYPMATAPEPYVWCNGCASAYPETCPEIGRAWGVSDGR